MQSFMKSMTTIGHGKENATKAAITSQLSEAVKDIIVNNVDDSDNSEAANTLCSAIEAMFLHGMKDSITHMFRRAIADVDQRPEPNFWAPLLVISHRQIIDQIASLSQIVTDIGQCRAWIRLAFNDSMLSSYLTIMQRDPSALKPYYNTFAYVRDSDLLEISQKLIASIEGTILDLPCNSSLLNSWPVPTLLLARIWFPTLRTTPAAAVLAGVDVLQSLEESAANSDTCSLASMVSQSSGIGQIVALNQDEALKIILAKHSYQEPQDIDYRPAAASKSDDKQTIPQEIEQSDLNVQTNSLGNSLKGQSGWSFDETNTEPKQEVQHEDVENRKSMEHSYNDIIENSYNIFNGTHMRTPDLRDMLQHFQRNAAKDETEETIPSPLINEEPVIRRSSLTINNQVSVIAKEKGLDSQDYTCQGCKEAIIKPQICSFTGEYFCNACMAKDPIPIPARIIHNWDFKRYPVSQKTFNCLDEIKDHPIIDFKTTNPYIYTAVEEMSRLQVLRNQLNYLRAYLYTCREPVIEELQKQMWPREYMYEHIHQYSISDLTEIKDGGLAAQLEKVVQFGTDHVLNCWLCSQKGFLCEICDQSKAVFPFDTKNVYRCNLCSGVYHKSCLNALQPCPRCERIKKRNNNPLLEAILD